MDERKREYVFTMVVAPQCNIYRHPDGTVWWGPFFEGCVLIASCPTWEGIRSAVRLLSDADLRLAA